MKLNKVFKKTLIEIQRYCEEHDCKNCRLCPNPLKAYIGCPLRYPRNWKINDIDLSQLFYGDSDFDRFDLYDYFDEDEEDENERFGEIND